MGRAPFGDVTVPVMLVVPPPAQTVCCVQRPVHVDVEPQTFGVPAPPQVPVAQAPPQLTTPPQPSATTPQFWPAGHDVLGVHALPHALGTPPPPQVVPAIEHVPQSMRAP